MEKVLEYNLKEQEDPPLFEIIIPKNISNINEALYELQNQDKIIQDTVISILKTSGLGDILEQERPKRYNEPLNRAKSRSLAMLRNTEKEFEYTPNPSRLTEIFQEITALETAEQREEVKMNAETSRPKPEETTPEGVGSNRSSHREQQRKEKESSWQKIFCRRIQNTNGMSFRYLHKWKMVKPLKL